MYVCKYDKEDQHTDLHTAPSNPTGYSSLISSKQSVNIKCQGFRALRRDGRFTADSSVIKCESVILQRNH